MTRAAAFHPPLSSRCVPQCSRACATLAAAVAWVATGLGGIAFPQELAAAPPVARPSERWTPEAVSTTG